MLCIDPYRPGGRGSGREYGCGKCPTCRLNRSRVWTIRFALEAASHVYPGTFVTLTYSPAFLPVGGTLVPGHLEQWRYKLRYRIGAFRYFAVGEYGERSGRAHYHVLVFGHSLTRKVVEEAWHDDEGRLRGHAHVGALTIASAAYCAGYVTSKLTRENAPELQGRHREFSRMSRRPGVGARGLQAIREWLVTKEGSAYVAAHGDVPQVGRVDGKIYPLGRYLVGKLREEVCLEEGNRVRQAVARAKIEALSEPGAKEAREYKRINQFRRYLAYAKLKRSKERL